jgi:hypothetical protein
MSEKERIESYIAMCACCLLAKAMKTCSTCQFKIGLADRVELVEHVEPIALPIPFQVMVMETV